MTSVDTAGRDPVDRAPDGDRRAGVGGWLLRVVGLVSIVAGLVLGVLGWSAFAAAAADEDRTDRVEAERDEIAVELARKERQRDRRLDRIAANQDAGRELQDAAAALSDGHSGFFYEGPLPGPILDRAVDQWNAGDHAAAVAVLDVELTPAVATLRDRLRQIEFAEAVIRAAARRLPEPPR